MDVRLARYNHHCNKVKTQARCQWSSSPGALDADLGELERNLEDCALRRSGGIREAPLLQLGVAEIFDRAT